MDALTNFIKSFHKRSGTFILFASIFAKITSFITSLIIVKLIPNKELGVVIFAYNICSFIFPLAGVGLYQGLLTYSPLLVTPQKKRELYNYVQSKGLKLNIIIIVIGVLVTLFIKFSIPNTRFYVIAFLFILIPNLFLENVKIYLKVFKKNKLFAYTEVIYNLILFITSISLAYFYEEVGYAAALILTPFITSLVFLPQTKLNFKNISKPQIINIDFWKFGITAAFTSISSQVLVVIDILLVGIIIADPEAVTSYRYISIIPISILFLPQVFMNTDYVSLTENIYNKNIVYRYIKNYITTFSIISILILLSVTSLSTHILNLIDSNFVKYHECLIILTIGILPILILRGLFGNILSSIKCVKVNMYIVLIGIVLNIVGNYYFIPQYNLKGAAITSAIVMWFTSILSMISFFVLYRRVLQKS